VETSISTQRKLWKRREGCLLPPALSTEGPKEGRIQGAGVLGQKAIFCQLLTRQSVKSQATRTVVPSHHQGRGNENLTSYIEKVKSKPSLRMGKISPETPNPHDIQKKGSQRKGEEESTVREGRASKEKEK